MHQADLICVTEVPQRRKQTSHGIILQMPVLPSMLMRFVHREKRMLFALPCHALTKKGIAMQEAARNLDVSAAKSLLQEWVKAGGGEEPLPRRYAPA